MGTRFGISGRRSKWKRPPTRGGFLHGDDDKYEQTLRVDGSASRAEHDQSDTRSKWRHHQCDPSTVIARSRASKRQTRIRAGEVLSGAPRLRARNLRYMQVLAAARRESDAPIKACGRIHVRHALRGVGWPSLSTLSVECSTPPLRRRWAGTALGLEAGGFFSN